MLSYRKSQQASLTEKLKKKNVIHVLGVSGSGTTMARLCLSAFARVATSMVIYDLVERSFATAHSRGLRLVRILQACLQATLPQRIRAGCDLQVPPPLLPAWSLPQRIRAGCDIGKCRINIILILCHSAFARVATMRTPKGFWRL